MRKKPFGPESSGFCCARKKSAVPFGLPAGRKKRKAGILGSGLTDHKLVAGVRFELTTFGL